DKPTTVENPDVQNPMIKNDADSRRHMLGPGDQITIQALHAEEITNTNKPIIVDAAGDINLPLIGRLHAAGLTVQELEKQVTERLKVYIQEPQVALTLVEVRSQPVSVIGQVNQPGV